MTDPEQRDSFASDSNRGPSAPPSTNRGVTVGIHWLSLTYFINPSIAMVHFLNNFLGYSIENRFDWFNDFYALNRGARGYRAILSGPENVRLYAYPYTGKHCHLEIPGELLEKYGSEHVLAYLKALTEWEHDWQATRVDIAFDGVPFTPGMCRTAWQEGRTRGRMHKSSWKWYENDEGSTFSMGSRQSGRYIRIYDRRGPTRLEIEFKDKWAKAVAEHLASTDAKYWLCECIGMIRDFIDFQDCRPRDGTSQDGSLASWWAAFVDGAEHFKISPTREVRTVSRARAERYLHRLTPTLCILAEGLGISLDEIVKKNRDLISDRHVAAIARLKN